MAKPAELPHEPLAEFKAALKRIQEFAIERQENLSDLPTISTEDELRKGLEELPRSLPSEGNEYGLKRSINFLFDSILPTLAQGQAGPRYFGFVTGGTLPSALLADMMTTLMDTNVQVHLPKETLSTIIEKFALDMILDVLHMDRSQWTGTFTTGATASNTLALACGRQATLQRAYKIRRQRRRDAGESLPEEEDEWDPAENGLYGPDVPPIKVFVCQAHASIQKSAAVLGIGRKNVIDLGIKLEIPETGDKEISEEEREQMESLARAETLDFDFALLESALRECQANAEGAIVVMGMGEVVTGALTDQTLAIRLMCDKYGAWLHMDAAFSAFVCLHEEYHWLSTHMGVCDSLTSDGHKALNIPYDCGILYVKKHSALREGNQFIPPEESRTFMEHTCYLDDICGPSRFGSGPSYLASAPLQPSNDEDMTDAQLLSATLPSPLHRNLENSRRFRALPVYISLLSQGHRGVREMVERNLHFAARVRQWLRSSQYYQVLTPASSSLDSKFTPHNGRLRAAPGERNPPRWEDDFWATTVVLFRPHPKTCPIEAFKDEKQGHLRFIDAVKHNRIIYISPGSFCGIGAARIAVSNWYTVLMVIMTLTKRLKL
ncbi:hypothetical protein L7F22_039319 [Adiantum nelumboides]|nr:hypothetical protein [Adiantum nelumboides]